MGAYLTTFALTAAAGTLLAGFLGHRIGVGRLVYLQVVVFLAGGLAVLLCLRNERTAAPAPALASSSDAVPVSRPD